MKAPRIDLRSVGEFLLRHGEKIVAGVVGLVAALLIWGGAGALRTLSVTDAQSPDAVGRVVKGAREHIDREPQAPADQLPKREPLAEEIDPWRTPLVPWSTGTSSASLAINPPPSVAVLDRPLFEEAAKRGRPDVLPLEDLRAVAGLAVLPVMAAPGAAAGAGGAGARAGGAEAPLERARIVPYVIVTGLIPARKQQEEYRRRFDATSRPSDHDPKRDRPLWCDFEIDRGTIGKDGKETWTKIDLAAVAKKRSLDWGPAAAAAVALDPEFLLATTEDARARQTSPLPFVSPLPQRLEGDWNLGDLHPWILENLLAKRDAEARGRERGEGVETADAGPGRAEPGFGVPDAPEIRNPEPEAGQDRADLPDYRLFRFVDTDVATGTRYRYRVRLKVWNPNYSKDPEEMRPHLAEPTDAVELKLASADSQASTDALVPDPTRVLVGPLRSEELKELKIRPNSGTLEVLVLGPSEQSGRFALRALVADPGAVVDVDELSNTRNQRDRARGEKITTRRLLVDARGRQEDARGAEKGRPPAGIPEPVEVICLRPDGSFEFASADDSEPLIEANQATLPTRSAKGDTKGTALPDPGQGVPPDQPPPRPGGRKPL